jgi:tRNA threonylcarbamoyl adenosine modification protein (Sua5/YciO/YrdC/YwlC family)
MAQYFEIHPRNPQARLIREAVAILRRGGLIVYPTDSLYALGCLVGEKAAMERLRWIRDIDERHHLTLMCRDLSVVGEFARLDNRSFRLVKDSTPGCYTFILPASGDLPRRVSQARSKAIGVRIPANPISIALLEELGAVAQHRVERGYFHAFAELVFVHSRVSASICSIDRIACRPRIISCDR